MSNRWSESEAQRDWLIIKNIHRKFGTVKLKTFPHTSIWRYFYNKLVQRQSTINILNYIDYNKTKGMETIQKELDWVYYGGKHYESIYTRFTQAYIQPRKFNIDKRKAHLSNLICSGEITRDQALKLLQEDAYPSLEMMQQDKEFFEKKLDMTPVEFEAMMKAETYSYLDYKGYYNFHNILKTFNYYGKRAD